MAIRILNNSILRLVASARNHGIKRVTMAASVGCRRDQSTVIRLCNTNAIAFYFGKLLTTDASTSIATSLIFMDDVLESNAW